MGEQIVADLIRWNPGVAGIWEHRWRIVLSQSKRAQRKAGLHAKALHTCLTEVVQPQGRAGVRLQARIADRERYYRNRVRSTSGYMLVKSAPMVGC